MKEQCFLNKIHLGIHENCSFHLKNKFKRLFVVNFTMRRKITLALSVL